MSLGVTFLSFFLLGERERGNKLRQVLAANSRFTTPSIYAKQFVNGRRYSSTVEEIIILTLMAFSHKIYTHFTYDEAALLEIQLDSSNIDCCFNSSTHSISFFDLWFALVRFHTHSHMCQFTKLTHFFGEKSILNYFMSKYILIQFLFYFTDY